MDQDFSKRQRPSLFGGNWAEMGQEGQREAMQPQSCRAGTQLNPSPAKLLAFRGGKGKKKKISQPQIINKRDESLERNSTKPQVALCLGRFC